MQNAQKTILIYVILLYVALLNDSTLNDYRSPACDTVMPKNQQLLKIFFGKEEQVGLGVMKRPVLAFIIGFSKF
jgi:hypothetical protein